VLALTPPHRQRHCAACEVLTARHVALLAFATRLPATTTTSSPATAALRRHVEPGRLRQAAVAALAVFPDCAALLTTLTAAEMRCSAWTRLRRELDTAAAAAQSLPSWLQALRVEAQSTPDGLGAASAHRVRALLERAASSSSTFSSSSSASAAAASAAAYAPHGDGDGGAAVAAAAGATPLVWRVYQAYELAGGRPDAAKRVFFRAVNACPWSKALWLDGLRALHGVLPPGEMGELLEVMTEKGLRLRTDIFEALLEDAGGVEGVPMCEKEPE